MNSTHFENGCTKAQAEIQNKLGNRFGNEKVTSISFVDSSGQKQHVNVPNAEMVKYHANDPMSAAKKYLADKYPGAKIKSVGSGTI